MSNTWFNAKPISGASLVEEEVLFRRGLLEWKVKFLAEALVERASNEALLSFRQLLRSPPVGSVALCRL